MKSRVNWNRHKKQWSVKGEYGRSYFDTLVLEKCEMRVSQRGRLRVIKDQKRNVHAYILGNFKWAFPENFKLNKQLKYNPYVCDSFFDVISLEKIERANYCIFMSDGRVYYG